MSAEFRVVPGARGALPVVWLHGFLGQPGMWAPVLAAMTRAPASALAVLPGHGPTPWYPAGEGFDGAVEALAAALPFPGRVGLVGYSMGARLALALALAHPERVAGAVLLGADPGMRDPAVRVARQAWDDAQAATVERDGIEAFVTGWESLPVFATQAVLPADVRARRRQERLGHTVAGVAWALRSLGTGRMAPRWGGLAGCAVPLRFVAGTLDAKFAAEAAEAAEATPRGTVGWIEGAGHDAALEAPDALARTVEAFFTEIEGGRA